MLLYGLFYHHVVVFFEASALKEVRKLYVTSQYHANTKVPQ